ncbi:MAG TPA: hypothetical protein VKB68_01255 [Stellaceae bacterium]|nr:hypothetical protein [Stellaceae bacterium]
MKALLAGLCIVGLLAPAAWAAKPVASVFDPPLKTQKLTLPANEVGHKPKLTCRYFAHFMVKEIDEGEVGAAQLSIVPIGGGAKPACQRKNVAGEKVVDPRDWSGYFKGVKGDYVLFDADDGVNGGLGFAIVAAATGKKLFEDSALGNLKSVALNGSALIIRYARSYSGDCSVPHDGATCWTKIATAAAMGAAPQPDCAAGYLKAKNDMAKGRCQADKKPGPACIAAALRELDKQRWNEAPSVIVYDAETVLKTEGATVRPVGPVRACHPSD